MPVDIKVPSVGESISEGSLARWLKKDGAQIHIDEPLFELETEKATQEVPAPATGVLRIKVAEGKTVAIGSIVGAIDTSAAAPNAARPPEPPKAVADKPAPVKNDKAMPDGVKPPLSPAARRLASEEGVSTERLIGTGPRGAILKPDVQEVIERQKPPPAAAARPADERETRERMSAIRQRIAERLVSSQKQTASLTTFNEADMSAITGLRTRYKEKFKATHDVGLGFMSFFVKASIEALKAYPLVNARLEDADIVHQHYYNIGVAVSTDKGLMVPVLHDAERMTFAQIEKAIAALAIKARDGKISVGDLQGGTFTITNGGIFGSMLSTPILNPPQSAILGMHAIQERPVVREGQIVIRPMMYLALTYDHRLIDGREAVLFLVRIKECLEDPQRLLLEI